MKTNSMENYKKELRLNYKGSGIKSLEVIVILFFILGGITLAINILYAVPVFINRSFATGIDNYMTDEEASSRTALIAVLFYISVSSYIGAIFLKVVLTIAKTSLYQRMIIEQEYEPK